jgi:hypothetical protein
LEDQQGPAGWDKGELIDVERRQRRSRTRRRAWLLKEGKRRLFRKAGERRPYAAVIAGKKVSYKQRMQLAPTSRNRGAMGWSGTRAIVRYVIMVRTNHNDNYQ